MEASTRQVNQLRGFDMISGALGERRTCEFCEGNQMTCKSSNGPCWTKRWTHCWTVFSTAIREGIIVGVGEERLIAKIRKHFKFKWLTARAIDLVGRNVLPCFADVNGLA
jgi:hypothetical protein